MCIFTRLSHAVLALALLLTAPASAQILWQRVLGTADFRENSAVTLAVPGGYLNVGVQLQYTAPQQLFLTHVREDGTVRWQRQQALKNLRILYTHAAVVDAAGQLYVSVSGFPDEKSSSGMLVKFTPDGDTVWTRRVTGVEPDKASLHAMLLAADGGVVVLGRQQGAHFVAKYAATGALLWRRTYDYSAEHPGYLEQIGKLPTGFLVVQRPTGGGFGARSLLLDEEGQLVSEKPTSSFATASLRPDQAGNLLLAAGGLLVKISPPGDASPIGDYRLHAGGFGLYYAAETPQGGRYLLAGTVGPFQNADLALLLVDKQGTVLRDTILSRPFAHEQPTGIAFDAQGNYVIGGYATQGPRGGDEAPDEAPFVLKIRSWDRLLPTGSRPARSQPDPAYRLYPNPATGTDPVRVSTGQAPPFSGSYELRDGTGRLLRAGRLAAGQPLPLGELPAGLYLVRLHDGRGWWPALRLTRP